MYVQEYGNVYLESLMPAATLKVCIGFDSTVAGAEAGGTTAGAVQDVPRPRLPGPHCPPHHHLHPALCHGAEAEQAQGG